MNEGYPNASVLLSIKTENRVPVYFKGTWDPAVKAAVRLAAGALNDGETTDPNSIEGKFGRDIFYKTDTEPGLSYSGVVLTNDDTKGYETGPDFDGDDNTTVLYAVTNISGTDSEQII